MKFSQPDSSSKLLDFLYRFFLSVLCFSLFCRACRDNSFAHFNREIPFNSSPTYLYDAAAELDKLVPKANWRVNSDLSLDLIH